MADDYRVIIIPARDETVAALLGPLSARERWQIEWRSQRLARRGITERMPAAAVGEWLGFTFTTEKKK